MQPGAETPAAATRVRLCDLPVTEYGCVRRFMRNGKVTREVGCMAFPGKPYFARATRRGRVRAGQHQRKVIIFDKLVLKRERE